LTVRKYKATIKDQEEGEGKGLPVKSRNLL
jgi:hypothetical protein